MKLFKLELLETPFWFLNNKISLTKEKPKSDYYALEYFSEQEQISIELSLRKRIIAGYDIENNPFSSFLDLKICSGEHDVDLEDIDDGLDEDCPKVISVTEESEKEIIISEDDYEDAKILLKRNGNTVKKIINNYKVTDETKIFLLACLEVEKQNKNRKNIVAILDEKTKGF